MPLKGITDKPARAKRVGKVRLGEKVARGDKQFPRALDHFVVRQDEVTKEAAARRFHEVYGDKPRTIHIWLPSENVDDFLDVNMKRYAKGVPRPVCVGDGETATMLDVATGEKKHIVCDPFECEWVAKKHCRRVCHFQFIIPDVSVALWQIDTTSYKSIRNLRGDIEHLRRVTSIIPGFPNGVISFIKIPLTLIPEHDTTPDGKPTMNFVLSLQTDNMNFDQLQAMVQHRQPSQMIIPAPDDKMPTDLYPKALQQSDSEAGNGSSGQLEENSLNPEQDGHDFFDPFAIIDPEEEKRQDTVDVLLHQAFDALGAAERHRNALLSRAKRPEDKQRLLERLQKEIARRKAAAEKEPAVEKPAPPAAAAAPADAGDQPPLF